MSRRLLWLDNLRWALILLVVVFHTAAVLNSGGSPLTIAPGVPLTDALPCLLYPWLMPCMFLIAGVSARYALEERTAGAFLRSRVRKLLLPLTASLVLIGPLLASFTARMNGQTLKTLWTGMNGFFGSPLLSGFFLTLTGLGPQWFLLDLLVCSLLLLPLRGLGGPFDLPLPALLALAAPCWLSSLVLNFDNRHLLYLLCFLLGHFFLARAEVLNRLKRCRAALALAAVVLGCMARARFRGTAFNDLGFLTDPLTVCFAWLAVLAALGWAQVLLDRSGPVSRFLARRSFALYLFHYLPLIMAAWWTGKALGLPPALCLALTLCAGLGGPLILYELLSRVPLIKTAFALKGQTRAA